MKFKDTKFGRMLKHNLEANLSPKVEFMQFEKTGTPHTHDVDEYALCVGGLGSVFVSQDGVTKHEVCSGDLVHIPAGASHWMDVPFPGSHLDMVIFYAAEENLDGQQDRGSG